MKDKLKLGFPGSEKEVEVERPDGVGRPWDLTTEFSVVGTDQTRLDAVDKVTGKAKYSYDRRFAGLIYAKMVRSPHASAEILSIDLSRAKALPGVLFTETFERPIRYAGQEVAGIAAESEEILDDAMQLVEIEYEISPCVVTVDDAKRDGAPQVARGSNVVPPGRPRGDLEKVRAAHKRADVVKEAEYRTQVQTHSCLEPHGSVCKWENGKLTCYASTQGTFVFKARLAQGLRISPADVTVITEHMGGGFGSKFGADLWDLFCARAAKATGRPCRLLLDRRAEHLVAGNRPDSIQKCRFSVTRDGTLMGAEVESWGTAGTAGGGAGVLNPGIYSFDAIYSHQSTVRTHAARGRAFRAPAHPQGVFALEGMIDELAEAIGMDPLALRKKNDPNPVRQAQYDVGSDEIGWQRRKPSGSGKGRIKRGLGMASARWGHNARPGTRMGPHGARCVIESDGSVLVANGCQDLGTGTRTIIAMLAAEELGLKTTDVTVRLGNTNDPVGPPSGGSQTAPSIAPVVRNVARRAKRQLLEAVAKGVGGDADKMDMKGGKVTGAPRDLTFKQACKLAGGVDSTSSAEMDWYRLPSYTGEVAGVQFAEVEVDTETGRVRVLRIVAVQDCGLVINPLLARSQINGGVIQGVSYALLENRVLDHRSGNMVNADFLGYKIAGSLDVPDIKAIAFSVANGKSTTGVSSLGEPPTIPTAGAIANAVANAIGVRIRSLPITPDKVLAALEAIR